MVMAIAIAIDKLAPAAVNVEMESSLICLPWKIAVEKPQTQDAIKMGEKKGSRRAKPAVNPVFMAVAEHYCMQMKSEMSRKCSNYLSLTCPTSNSSIRGRSQRPCDSGLLSVVIAFAS